MLPSSEDYTHEKGWRSLILLFETWRESNREGVTSSPDSSVSQKFVINSRNANDDGAVNAIIPAKTIKSSNLNANSNTSQSTIPINVSRTQIALEEEIKI